MNVTKTLVAVVILAFISSISRPQTQTPKLLIRSAHCLAAKGQLARSKATALTFGYLLDENSYPGQKVLYVVEFASPTEPKGFAWAIFIGQDGDLQVFNIQNNTSFVLSKGELHGVKFVNPPLGGVWTQDHLAFAIERIVKQPRFIISVKDTLASDPSTRCESYTDPQH